MAKGTFTAKVSSGAAAGFSGIPGKGNYSATFGQQFGKSFGKAYKKAQAKPGKPVEPKPGSTGGGISSEDTVTGDKTYPTRNRGRALGQVYEGEVVEPLALPAGKKEIENNIIDAEVIETPKAIGGSRKAIGAPPQKALPAPRAPRASSPVGSANKGKQFTAVSQSGVATPMAKTPYGDAVRLD